MEYKTKDFQPLRDNILVKQIVIEKKGKYNIPRNEEDKSELGEVLGVGDEVVNIKVGNIVMFNKYSSVKVDIGDEELIVRQEDVVAIKKK